jgi:hypothetical protein
MKKASILALVVSGFFLAAGCGDDDDDDDGNDRPELTGAMCEVPDDCFKTLEERRDELIGDIQCLDRVRDGYCTHTCTADADCCAVEGECKTYVNQICSPFESTDVTMCFISCEDEDLRSADGTTGTVDPNEFCQREASSDFICRASGGGDPHKICVPGDCGVGASCAADADCDTGLVCLTGFRGGYCGLRDCSTNEPCPAGSFCVEHSNGSNYCMVSCAAESDCSFCRRSDTTECVDNADFVDALTPAGTRVCMPSAG